MTRFFCYCYISLAFSIYWSDFDHIAKKRIPKNHPLSNSLKPQTISDLQSNAHGREQLHELEIYPVRLLLSFVSDIWCLNNQPNFRSPWAKRRDFTLVSPVLGSLTGVLAKTVNTSAISPLEIHIFDPFRSQCLPSGDSSARVLIEPASKPDEGALLDKSRQSSLERGWIWQILLLLLFISAE